jgi:hypothetical protein
MTIFLLIHAAPASKFIHGLLTEIGLIIEINIFVSWSSLRLAALGLSGYGGNSIFTGWGDSARIEIAIGAALGVLGMILRKEGR